MESQKEDRIQVIPTKVNDEYKAKWNVNSNDFVVITKNGERINDSIYRIGGFGFNPKEDYFILLKQVEEEYTSQFLRKVYPNESMKQIESRRKHLENRSCIIDKNGIEKKTFGNFESPYIVKNSCLYTMKDWYYNIETGEEYCQSFKSVESSDFIFLQNNYDKDKSRRGVIQVNKKDGKFVILK